MRFNEAMLGLETLEPVGSSVEVRGAQYDSRRVGPSGLFVAMHGGSVDGNRFVEAALAGGAAAIVTDAREVWERLERDGVPVALVANGRRALAGVAANLLGHPELALKVSAVTGTNGKTTTAWLLEQLLRSVERKIVLIGTIETHVGDEVRVSEHTTPEASDLLQVFADGVAAGTTEAVMEMSSHALDQERVWGVPVDVAIFTNLTQDHLDYHGTMEAYGAAKEKLFEGVGAAPPRVAVVNVEDEFGRNLASRFRVGELMTYGFAETATYRAAEVRYGLGHTDFELVTPLGEVMLRSPLTGRVNVSNLLAASCAALARGLTLEQIAAAVPKLRQVPGRFETVPNELGLTVVVDYAHTDDALRNLIAIARELVGAGRVITMFGCGGDRDRSKRPKMGHAAGQGSDVVVVTSDNPRSEDPDAIIEEALAGVRLTDAEYVVEPDRREAISMAIHAAKAGDVVLLAGKGHEKVQIFADGTVPFDDVAIAAHLMRAMEN